MRGKTILFLWAALAGVALADPSLAGPGSLPGRWSPESKCCRPPWDRPEYRQCALDEGWEALTAKVQQGTIDLKTGGLGTSAVPRSDGKGNRFDVWLCVFDGVFDVPCDKDSGSFCFVYDEVDNTFVPWGPNSELRLFGSMDGPKEVFAMLDVNKDGCIDKAEFDSNPPPIPVSFDAASGGKQCIKMDEGFSEFLQREDYKFGIMFMSLDQDGDQCISSSEYDARLNPLSEKGYTFDNISDFHHLDTDCLSVLDIVEFGYEYHVIARHDGDEVDLDLPPINGEQACEGLSWTQTECLQLGHDCCQWSSADGECHSAIGQGLCTGLDPLQVAHTMFMSYDADKNACLSMDEFRMLMEDFYPASSFRSFGSFGFGSGSGYGRQVLCVSLFVRFGRPVRPATGRGRPVPRDEPFAGRFVVSSKGVLW